MKSFQSVRLYSGNSYKAPINASVAVVPVIFHAKLAAECDCLMLVVPRMYAMYAAKIVVEHRHSSPEANDWVTCKIPACNNTGKALVADWHIIQQSAKLLPRLAQYAVAHISSMLQS